VVGDSQVDFLLYGVLVQKQVRYYAGVRLSDGEVMGKRPSYLPVLM
jgi:hypothetical protein